MVVPLQRLKIQDDSFLEVQKNKPEAKVPAPPPKISRQICVSKMETATLIFTKFTASGNNKLKIAKKDKMTEKLKTLHVH